MVRPPMCTTSNLPSCSCRVSSGDSKRFRITPTSIMLLSGRGAHAAADGFVVRVYLPECHPAVTNQRIEGGRAAPGVLQVQRAIATVGTARTAEKHHVRPLAQQPLHLDVIVRHQAQ